MKPNLPIFAKKQSIFNSSKTILKQIKINEMATIIK